MRGQKRSADVSTESGGHERPTWGESVVHLLGAMAAAELASVVVSLLCFWDIEVVGAALLIPLMTVLPCVLVFVILDRFSTVAAAWIALTLTLILSVVVFVVTALIAHEKPEIGWYVAGTTFVSGVAACVTLMRMTCSQNREREQTGIRRDQP